jgi:hypothetical protein
MNPLVAAGDTSVLTWHNLFHTIEGIVAVATLALAAATVGLAFMTWRMAVKTRELAASTADEIELTRQTARRKQAPLASAHSRGRGSDPLLVEAIGDHARP